MLFDPDAEFGHALSPLDVGGLTLRNRIFVSAHVPGFAEDNKVSDRYIAYHRARAAGGVALQLTGCTAVHKSGLLSLSSDGLRSLDDSVVPGYRKLADAIHEEAGRMLAQIGHSGGAVYLNQPGHESWSASAVRSEITGAVSHPMSACEIAEVVEAFGYGARRAAAGGLDGVEILSAFGYLPHAFLSPLTNFRDDDYGGSLENRMRFLLEVIDIVRGELNADQILGVRIPGDEFQQGGLDLEAMKEVSRRLAATGKVDYLNIIAHSNFGHTGRALHWAPTPSPHGGFIPLASAIKQEVDIPVFGIGRVTDPAHAERIIAAGDADMVGMTRAHLTDPSIVRRMMQGDVHRIRPCVGANVCIAARYNGKPIRCMHNPQLKTPGVEIVRTDRPKHVAVVGAGPAGLEVARVAAERGHRVTLFESDHNIGGQVNLWSAAPSMKELYGMVRWRESELELLGVEIRLGVSATVGDLTAPDIDAVVLATGASPMPLDINGDGTIPVIDAYTLIRGTLPEAGSAIVWSDGRGQAGLVAAELLSDSGCATEVITSDIAVAADLDPTVRTSWYLRLGEADVRLSERLIVDEIRGGRVVLRDVFSNKRYYRDGVELIADWRGLVSNEDLYDQLVESGVNVHRVGDCVAPRTLEIATSEAFDVANAL